VFVLAHAALRASPTGNVFASRIFTSAADRSGASILELHLRLDLAMAGARIQGAHQLRIALGDEAAPHLARAGQFAVVRVELLVQHEEAADLGIAELRVGGEIAVHFLHAFLHQFVYRIFWARSV